MLKNRKEKRGNSKKIAYLLLAMLLIMNTLVGCGNTESGAAGEVAAASEAGEKWTYSEEDLDASWEEASATKITLEGTRYGIDGEGASAGGSVLTIEEAGTYVLSGGMSEGQVVVAAGEEDVVRIVLNGVDITASQQAPINIVSAEKAILILAEGTENKITDGSNYIFEEGEEEPDAAIFSKSDLTINGKGTLTVSANYKNGIVSKDELVITGGEINITAINDGLKGKDSVAINDGNINILQSNEGIEGAKIWITGGTILVKAEDDGLNAAGDTENGDYSIQVDGGTLTVDASGDGLDSNGSLYINGGTVVVNGPTNNGNGAMDYNGEGVITGGTLILAGSAGMSQAPGTSSTQQVLAVQYTTLQAAGTTVTLQDEEGNAIVEFSPTKEYQSVVISTPELVSGGIYTLLSEGSELTKITLAGVVTSVAEDGSAVTGRGGMGGPGGVRPEGERPEKEGKPVPGEMPVSEATPSERV